MIQSEVSLAQYADRFLRDYVSLANSDGEGLGSEGYTDEKV